MTGHSRLPGGGQGGRPRFVLLAILVLCCGVELTLVAADLGLIGTPRWRAMAYGNGAFWAGLLDNWRPNYAAQPWLMFVTYAFLHGDIWHLAGNMITLLLLGEIIILRAGQRGMAAIYAVSAVGGAVVFGLMTSSMQPMVGASGALFGLAGAWLFWEWADRRRFGLSFWPVVWIALGLVVFNVLLWAVLAGRVAWETHLGGFLAGWIAALVLSRLGLVPTGAPGRG